jgi:RND family efflux transporter MFP subunit
MPPRALRVGAERQQIPGLRIAEVKREQVSHTVHVQGTVNVDETRIYIINATIDGWITKTFANSTGYLAKTGEVLATFYSPEFTTAIQALLYAQNAIDRVQVPPGGQPTQAQKDQLTQYMISLRQYKNTLRNLGMGEAQVDEVIRKRAYTENVEIASPGDGFILARKVSPGLRFVKGEELYRLADLSKVWILADVYREEANFLAPGAAVAASLPNTATAFHARVSHVPPTFDAQTQTVKVRLIADNPGFVLRPGMFVDVEFAVKMPPAIVVPADAVIDTGQKSIVYMDRGDGYIQPRTIQTGRRIGKQVEIVSGLAPGEKIVVSGNFVIDSESRMGATAQGIGTRAGMMPGQKTGRSGSEALRKH